MSTALDVAHLTVAFGRTEILRDVSFRVDRGTTLAIIGPNGSGKTVLLKALIGAVPATGSVCWEPGTIIGYVPQKLDIERDLPVTGLDFLRATDAALGTAVRHARPGMPPLADRVDDTDARAPRGLAFDPTYMAAHDTASLRTHVWHMLDDEHPAMPHFRGGHRRK